MGFITGEPASDAVQGGLALPFMGTAAAFTLARLHAPGVHPRLVRATDIPAPWCPALARVTAPPTTGRLPPGTLVMGILNATPDSFSNPGQHHRPADAIEAGHRMIRQGAAILDIGGESTRPGAAAPPIAEEIARILPIIAALNNAGAVISADTRRVPVMRAALEAGATMINDVSGLTHDPDAIAFLAGQTCTIAIMHMRGTPQTMQSHAHYTDIATQTVQELAQRVAAALEGGISPDRIVIDPGIGFAKTAAHNIELLARLAILANLSHRLLLGVSRKAFIDRIANVPDPDTRLAGSIAAATAARYFPAAIHRVHDVAAASQALLVGRAIDACEFQP